MILDIDKILDSPMNLVDSNPLQMGIITYTMAQSRPRRQCVYEYTMRYWKIIAVGEHSLS